MNGVFCANTPLGRRFDSLKPIVSAGVGMGCGRALAARASGFWRFRAPPIILTKSAVRADFGRRVDRNETMLNRVAARVFRRAACASLAIARVFAAAGGLRVEDRNTTYIEVDCPAPPEATSLEEPVYFSSVVARVKFLSSSAGVRICQTEDDRRARPAFAFRFRVAEYLKGNGDDELTVRVVALGRYDSIIYPDENEALTLMIPQSGLDERDTRWDGREAVVFLRPSPISSEAESGVYEFADRGDLSPGLDMVYPRPRGGTRREAPQGNRDGGLSPPTRGNPIRTPVW